MKSLRLSNYTNNNFSNLLDKFQKKKSNGITSITWILAWYFGLSILLLLSLHSYYMGISKIKIKLF